MKIERRQFRRYQFPDDTLCIFSNYSPVKGWVRDISEGGMAFEYTPIEGCEPKPEIRLILSCDAFPFYLPDISCKTICDIKANINDRQFKGTGTRHCSLQFGRLDTGMKEKLADLLSSKLMRRECKPFHSW